MTKTLTNFSAAILCGGRSRRMGFDKSLLRLSNGQLLVAALAEELERAFGQVSLITNSVQKFEGLKELKPFELIEDLHPGAGPAGAIRAALLALKGKFLFVMAGDMIVIDWNLIKKMAHLAIEQKADMVAPRCGQFYEPLYAFYGPAACEPLRLTLCRGGGAPMEISNSINFKSLDLEESDLRDGGFVNLNTPEQLKAAGDLTLKIYGLP